MRGLRLAMGGALEEIGAIAIDGHLAFILLFSPHSRDISGEDDDSKKLLIRSLQIDDLQCFQRISVQS